MVELICYHNMDENDDQRGRVIHMGSSHGRVIVYTRL